MRDFAQSRRLPQPERRIPLAQGSPGLAVSIDLEAYDKRRSAMLKLLEVAAGQSPFSEWMKHSEAIGARRNEKLDFYIEVLYILLEDIVLMQHGAPAARNPDAARELQSIAQRVSFEWVRAAVGKIDDLVEFARRNIQKTIALDALALSLRSAA
jgi:DNA polymerase-3 subunit delta'